MNITNLTTYELNILTSELTNLRTYLNSVMGNKEHYYYIIEQKFLELIKHQIFTNKTDLSNFLKQIPKPSDSISSELHNFFSNHNKQNNHYVQSSLLKNIITTSSNNLLYFNYSYSYKKFRMIANNNKSEEFSILSNLKNNYGVGIKKYLDYFMKNMNNNQNTISLLNQPQTYFINNYTENKIKTNSIEYIFITGIQNKSLSMFDIIRYFSLHYSRSSTLFLTAIKALYINLRKTNPISFSDYCVIQFFYHLIMITRYCNELSYFITNIDSLQCSIKPTNSIVFSDTIENTITKTGYTGIPVTSSDLLIIENKNNTFNNQNYLQDNFFIAQEFVCMSPSQDYIFYLPQFEYFFKNSFYQSIFPVNSNYKVINSIQKNFKPYLNNGYFLDDFKNLSKKFEI